MGPRPRRVNLKVGPGPPYFGLRNRADLEGGLQPTIRVVGVARECRFRQLIVLDIRFQNSHSAIIHGRSRAFRELCYRAAQERVDPLWGDLGRRLEGEAPLVKAGVGYLEFRTATYDAIGQQKIEIEHPRPPPLLRRAVAPRCHFEFAAAREQGVEIPRPVDDGRRVEVVGLGGSDGASLPESRG